MIDQKGPSFEISCTVFTSHFTCLRPVLWGGLSGWHRLHQRDPLALRRKIQQPPVYTEQHRIWHHWHYFCVQEPCPSVLSLHGPLSSVSASGILKLCVSTRSQ